MKTHKRQKHGRKEEERGKGGREGSSSNLLSLKIQNDNIHIKNIIRTIYHVYVGKYDYETGFSYIKDILKNIISGNVFDLEYNKYIDGNCIYELSARILLNIIRVHVKDVNFKKMVDFLFDMLYYCDGLLNEKKGVHKKRSESESAKGGESELVTKLWIRLIDNVFIKDKKQRLNLCKVVRAFLKKACAEQIDVPDKLYKKHVNVFLSLLNDKDHNIRTLCLHILEPFQDENTRSCFIKCFDDPHYIVRVTAIKNILIDPKELNNDGSVVMKAFIVRVNDTNAKVKISVYERMKSYYYCMPAMAKCELVLCGLNDKDKSVCESCYSMVIYWSNFFENRLENLLCSLIDGDYDTDGVVEQICKVHLSNAKKGNLKGNLKGVVKGKTSRVSGGIEAEDIEENEMGHDTGETKCTSNTDLEEGTYDERWFNYCNENLLFLNPGELYMFRIYVQHFADEQEKEKIDALQVVNAIYYYLYLSRFNESAYYQRKHYAYYMESVEDESHAGAELAECTCGKELIDSVAIEIERKRKYLETGEFDDECCDRCMFYISSVKKKMEEEIQDEKRGSGWKADKANLEKDEENEKGEEEEEEDEFTHIQQDNINENYGNVCNIKNLLLICKCLDIIEIYQVEKIMKCCETVLLIGPLREVLIKCFIYSYGPGVINYRIQKGHIDCAHWLSNYYEYACLDLLRQMIFKKHGGQETEEAEVATTNYILAILSEIKEPFDDPVKESSYLIGTRKRVQEEEANGRGEDSGGKPVNLPVNGDELEKKKSVESLTIPEICINIMDVEHDSVFSIIRKKDLSALKMVQLLLLTNKVQHKIDMTEARINDMSEVEMDRLQKKREREGIPADMPLEDDAESVAYRAQLAGLTNLFIKQVCMLTVIKHHLKRRWLRILFITEVFLSRSKSQCSFDSGLGEFPDELLLPALNFASTIMSHVEDKEVEDNFFEILCTRCLGCWSLFINDEKKLLSQVHAYNTAILSTYTTYQQSLAKLEEMHSVICPIIYMRSNHDTMSHLERGPNRLTGTEEGYAKRGSNEDEDCLLPVFGSNTSLFYEYTSPGDYLIYHFEENPSDWSMYSDVLKQLELETLRCEIFMSVIGDIVMTHPLLYRNPVISEAVDNLWNFLNGSVNVSKYIQSICIRVCAKVLLIEYISVEESNTLTSTDFLQYMNTATLRLRTLCEMCFLISPASYLCLQDFKRVSSTKITNINVHDKAFLFAVLSLFPTMSETNLLLFHQTFEDVLLKTSTAVLKYKLKTDYYTNLLTFMVFTIIHKASATFLVENMGKYIKWFLLIIIEKGYKLTNRSQIVELLFRIVQVYLFQDLENINNFGSSKAAEKKEVKKRGRKRKVNPEETEQNQKEEEDKEDGDSTKGGEMVPNENEKDPSKCTTVCLKCVENNVNEAIKELRCFFVLINFCIHSVDIIRSRTQVRYLENLKESIEKRINEIKEQFIKNNLVETATSNILSNSQQQEMEEKREADDRDGGLECGTELNAERVTNLLNLERLEKETEEDIYNEIIDDYVNYISQMDARDFAYGIIPSDFRDSPENDELTNKEIMEQLNQSSTAQLTSEQLNGGTQKVPKKRGRRRKVDIERERIMKAAEERRRQQEEEKQAPFLEEEKNKQEENQLEETVVTFAKLTEETHHHHHHQEHLEINATKKHTCPSNNVDKNISDANSSTQRSVHPVEHTGVNYDRHRSTSMNKIRSSKKSPIRQTKEGVMTRLVNRKRVSDLNMSSSEDDVDAGDSSVSDFESARSSIDSDGGGDDGGVSTTDSEDSAEKTFNRLNRLRRTSYINVVNK